MVALNIDLAQSLRNYSAVSIADMPNWNIMICQNGTSDMPKWNIRYAKLAHLHLYNNRVIFQSIIQRGQNNEKGLDKDAYVDIHGD